MLESHHHTLFYPVSETELSDATKKRNIGAEIPSLPSAILCPHASYTYALEALHSAFSPARNLSPSLVVFLGPLHQEVLSSDENAFLIGTECEGMRIGDREYGFATPLMQKLLKQFSPHITCQDSYFEEEPALELTLPFIESYLGSASVLPLLCGSANSKQIKLYSEILQTIVDEHPNTLFVVSTNANALNTSEQASVHAQAFLKSLLTKQSFIQQPISSCNRNSLESLSSLAWAKRKWEITGIFCKGESYEDIQSFADSKEKFVWQISAFLGASDA